VDSIPGEHKRCIGHAGGAELRDHRTLKPRPDRAIMIRSVFWIEGRIFMIRMKCVVGLRKRGHAIGVGELCHNRTQHGSPVLCGEERSREYLVWSHLHIRSAVREKVIGDPPFMHEKACERCPDFLERTVPGAGGVHIAKPCGKPDAGFQLVGPEGLDIISAVPPRAPRPVRSHGVHPGLRICMCQEAEGVCMETKCPLDRPDNNRYTSRRNVSSPERSMYSRAIMTNRGVPSAVLYAVSVSVMMLGIRPKSDDEESRCWNALNERRMSRASAYAPVTSVAPGREMNVSRPSSC